MKDSEFIELLNLYLDHEISAADAARLEAEVQNNPARRRVYQQYCRMQKACKMVVADFQAEAETLAQGDRKVVPFDPAAIAEAAQHRTRMNRFYTVGTFAAVAACLAIVFVRHQSAVPSAPGAVAETVAVVQPAPEPKAEPVPPAGPTPRGLVQVTPRTQPMLVSDPFLLTHNSQAQAMLAAAAQQANDQLAWLNTVQLAPLQQRVAADPFRFDSPPASLRSENSRALGNRSGSPTNPSDKEEHYIGFQFVK